LTAASSRGQCPRSRKFHADKLQELIARADARWRVSGARTRPTLGTGGKALKKRTGGEDRGVAGQAGLATRNCAIQLDEEQKTDSA